MILDLRLTPHISGKPAGALVAFLKPGGNQTGRLIGHMACNQRDGIGLAVESGCWTAFQFMSSFLRPSYRSPFNISVLPAVASIICVLACLTRDRRGSTIFVA